MIRRSLLAILVLTVLVIRFVPGAGEWYATTIYPWIARVLSAVASIVPYSLEEWIVLLVGAALIVYPIIGIVRHTSCLTILIQETELVLWIVAWFYLGWGCNYYRADFFSRLHVQPIATDEAFFLEYLNEFADNINECYPEQLTLTEEEIEQLIKKEYRTLPDTCGLCTPLDFQHPKKVAFNRLYSAVGVLGYMGPFMAESQLNLQLLPEQYPFTYAHELAHLLGISSEAEANYWAYYVCLQSGESQLKYCGYYGLLPYLIGNARSLLSPEEYQGWICRLDPRIIADLNAKSRYWQAQQIEWINDMQEAFYDWYLRSNRIPGGKSNYSQVVQMVLAVRKQGMGKK